MHIAGTLTGMVAFPRIRPETVTMSRRHWAGYVALGDALTEGVRDPLTPSASSWSSQLAAILDGNARLGGHRVDYLNLAADGERMRDVSEKQLPHAIMAQPDLVSIMAGGFELQLARTDPDELASRLETAVVALRKLSIDVLIANVVDPQLAFFMRPTRSRVAAFNANVWSIARSHAAYILDVWALRGLQSPSMWTADHRQFSAPGHRLVANRAAHTLGVPYFDLGAENFAPVQGLPVQPTIDV